MPLRPTWIRFLRAQLIWSGLLALTCASAYQEDRSGSMPEPCAAWNEAVEIGRLDPGIINESSGLEVSNAYENRLYHINDSGDAGRFYITDLTGNDTRTIDIEGFDPIDAEDIALGSCGAQGSCLFIADIGDNNRVRESIEIVVVREEEEFPEPVEPLYRLRVRYPEGAQDAEALAVHPNGDLYIITKAADYANLQVRPSRIYRIEAGVWRAAPGEITPVLVGEWDLSRISSDPFSGSLPTGADIREDGERLLVLTYNNAFEFVRDSWIGEPVPTADMVMGRDYLEIDIETLEQQESIAYRPGIDAFLYETEQAAGAEFPRIMEVGCRD